VTLACGRSTEAAHVDILPLPSASSSAAAVSWPGDPTCKPDPLQVIEATANGELDKGKLRDQLLSAVSYAERCCVGDESGDVNVVVTFAPEGYGTTVELEPESIQNGPMAACLSASFHRVVTKTFSGSALTVRVPLHIRSTDHN
jgi:hypothetical protein